MGNFLLRDVSYEPYEAQMKYLQNFLRCFHPTIKETGDRYKIVDPFELKTPTENENMPLTRLQKSKAKTWKIEHFKLTAIVQWGIKFEVIASKNVHSKKENKKISIIT